MGVPAANIIKKSENARFIIKGFDVVRNTWTTTKLPTRGNLQMKVYARNYFSVSFAEIWIIRLTWTKRCIVRHHVKFIAETLIQILIHKMHNRRRHLFLKNIAIRFDSKSLSTLNFMLAYATYHRNNWLIVIHTKNATLVIPWRSSALT